MGRSSGPTRLSGSSSATRNEPTLELVIDRVHPQDRERVRQEVIEHASVTGTDF